MVKILTLTLNPALDVSARTAQVRPTSKLRCDAVERHPGGGGVNVARVLLRLGADVAAWYPSGGTTGQLLTELLEGEGVPCHPIPTGEHTRESFTVLDNQTGEEYRFVLPGPVIESAHCDAIVQDVVKQLLRWKKSGEVAPLVVASGSLPPGAPVDVYARLARGLREAGVRLIVDTSGPALASALREGVYMAKPSLREFREFVGRPLESWAALANAAQELVRDGAAHILAVSCGEQGAVMAHTGGVLYAPALPVVVTSAVGAGDSFVAGMVWELANGRTPKEAFAFGVACGSAALASTGTSLCQVTEVQRLLPLVKSGPTLPEGSV
jgi:6-phosphofructokinase 2